MTLDSMVQDAASGLFVPVQARRSVIPYDDLQALNPPTTNAQISPDLISALSVLVAQGPLKPQLVNAASYGSLHTASQISVNAKITRPQNIGDKVLQIDDPTVVRIGAFFWIIQNPLAGGTQHGPYFGFPSTDPHVMTLGVGLAANASVGDIVFAVPYVMLLGGNNTVDVTDRAGRQIGVVASITQPPPLHASTAQGIGGAAGTVNKDIVANIDNNGDTYLTVRDAQFAVNTSGAFVFTPTQTPAETLVAVANFSWMVRSWSATVASNGTSVGFNRVRIQDVGPPVVDLWVEDIDCQALNGAYTRIGMERCNFPVPRGHAARIICDLAVAAGNEMTVAISGDLV